LIETLYGRSISEWAKINDVLEKHCIGDAKALENALKKPEWRVEVRNGEDHGDILGTLPMVDIGPGVERYRIQSVEFIVERNYHGGIIFFTTRAPLGLLLRIQDFRLTGETAERTEARRFDQ